MAKRWGFTYLFCNDLEQMKWFYTEIIGLNLVWDSEDSIAFKIGEHQLSIHSNKDFTPLSSYFAIQPGWEGGREARTSWSLECDKEDFNEIVQSVMKHEVTTYYSEPKWKGYWSFPILDPMNNTIEITCTEKNL